MLDTTAATDAPCPPAAYAFGRFVLRRRERLLLAGGAQVELGSRAVEVLLALVEADGVLLTKEALLDRAWPGVVVEENNLQVQISAIRRVLGSAHRDWIVTVSGRGYRFTGPVVPLAEAEAGTMADPAEAPRLSVLVLPFAGRGEGPARSWFADALTDSLTTDLTRALPPGGTVAAQTNADTYRDQGADARAIGREQRVRYLVEGSVLLAEDLVRVNAQLILAGTGVHLWAERFDLALAGGVLRIQDGISSRIARAVALRIVQHEAQRIERAARDRAGSLTAEDYVLLGLAASHSGRGTRHAIEAACGLFARALELAPENADALAGIACQRVRQATIGYLQGGWTVRADAEAREACLREAEEKLTRALAISPGHVSALEARSGLLRARGAFVDAIAAGEAVLAQNPGELAVHKEIGLSLLYLGRVEEALGWFRRADALGPGDPLRWTWLQGMGRALIQLGADAEAAEVLRQAVASNPTFAFSHALLAAALALAGEDAAARTALAEFRRAEPETPVATLARRSAVPFEATDALYRARNERLLEGLRRASGLADARPA
jgi:TolB-like protein/Tfp pilus assembly protein PilF